MWSHGHVGEIAGGLGKGTYDLTVVDGNGCSRTFSQSIGDGFGRPATKGATAQGGEVPMRTLALSPNPARDRVSVKYHWGQPTTFTLRVISLQGVEVLPLRVHEGQAGEYPLDISSLSNGVISG